MNLETLLCNIFKQAAAISLPGLSIHIKFLFVLILVPLTCISYIVDKMFMAF